jgi:hypothetical protein
MPRETIYPRIDIKPYYDGDVERTKQIALDLRDVCKRWGYFYITGHGLSPELIRGAMSEVNTFFTFQEAEKEKIQRCKSMALRGWEGVNDPNYKGSVSRVHSENERLLLMSSLISCHPDGHLFTHFQATPMELCADCQASTASIRPNRSLWATSHR